MKPRRKIKKMSREDECLNVRQPRSYSFYVDDFQPRKAQHAVSPWSWNQRDQPAIVRIIFGSGKLLLRFITGASLNYE